MITTPEGTRLDEFHHALYQGLIVTILLGPESSYQGQTDSYFRMYAANPPLTPEQMVKVLGDKMSELSNISIDEEGFRGNTKLNGTNERYSLGLVSYQR